MRQFVTVQEARSPGFSEISVQVGDKQTYLRQRFLGRELARRRERDREAQRVTVYTVYQTAKKRLALYTREAPDWSDWSAQWAQGNWGNWGNWDVDWDQNWDVDWSQRGDRDEWKRRWKEQRQHMKQQQRDQRQVAPQMPDWEAGSVYRFAV